MKEEIKGEEEKDSDNADKSEILDKEAEKKEEKSTKKTEIADSVQIGSLKVKVPPVT